MLKYISEIILSHVGLLHHVLLYHWDGYQVEYMMQLYTVFYTTMATFSEKTKGNKWKFKNVAQPLRRKTNLI